MEVADRRAKTLKDFAALQEEAREHQEILLTIRDVRNILSVSANVVINMLKDRKLEGYDLFQETPGLAHVHARSNGIRITPTSLKSYLEARHLI
jgi:predicted transcriptional regulator of viral defense system